MTGTRARFAWVLNLDAELELAQAGYAPRARVSSQLEQYGARSRELLGPDDVLLQPGAGAGAGAEWLGRPDAQPLVGRAWCPTPRALAAFSAYGVEPEPHPGVLVLTRVNHRRFAFELGGGLHGQHYLESRVELEAELRRARAPLLLKRPLAFAGRGQQRVYAHAKITEKEWSWIDASLRADGLIVEPLVEPTLELSLHGFIWRDGRQELGRPCVQTVSERGVFRGVRAARSSELTSQESRMLFEQAERVATALARADYFGPFGIDAYRYRLGASSGFCALSEINARYTMGFVTGFPRRPHELVL
jgi:hypothetical protein